MVNYFHPEFIPLYERARIRREKRNSYENPNTEYLIQFEESNASTRHHEFNFADTIDIDFENSQGAGTTISFLN